MSVVAQPAWTRARGNPTVSRSCSKCDTAFELRPEGTVCPICGPELQTPRAPEVDRSPAVLIPVAKPTKRKG